MKRLLFVLFIILIVGTANMVLSDVLRVPEQYEDIDAALDRARAQDTVLVADGVYRGRGNVDLEIGTRVTLMSENGPENCIIDGEEEIRNAFELTDRCRLKGFTIQGTTKSPLIINDVDYWRVTNCIITDISSQRDSVGSLVINSEGVIEFCEFSQLRGIRSGSAFYIRGGEVEFNYCYFFDVTADSMGGAFHIRQSADVTFTNCVFRGNSTRFWHGGAIAMFGNGTDVEINFCNFIDNEASNNWGGAIYKDRNSQPVIGNSIFWGNDADVGPQMGAQLGNDNRLIRIYNCIVQGGEDVEAGWFGDDLVEEAPEFDRGRNPIWGANNFYLDPESPGIDQGSDDAEELGMDNSTTLTSLEPDEGTVDIGYHYSLTFYHALGQLTGYVYDAEDGDPLDRALVKSSLGQEARTNRNGRWVIGEALADTTHALTATFHGYNDSTVFEIELEEGGQVETNFSLYHPEFSIDPVRIDAETDLGDTGRVDLTMSNSGNGPLEWTSRVELVGREREPWRLEETILAGQTVETRIRGVAYANDHYYVNSTKEDPPHSVYLFNMEGELVDSFPQFGVSNNGMYGMTYDGETIWGAESDSVFGFTPDGELVAKWPSTMRNTRYIAWDPDREWLWQGGRLNDLSASDREGNRAFDEDEDIDNNGKRVYGMAYRSDDPDGYPLYIITRLSNDDRGYVFKINPETHEMVAEHIMVLPVGKPATGFFTTDIDPLSMYFMTIGEAGNNDGGDKIMRFFIDGNSNWMMLDNTEGTVAPTDETVLIMRLYSERFDYGQFEGQLTITHNALNSPMEIPIRLNILDVPINDEPIVPSTSSLQSVYPNPFNSKVTVNFLSSNYDPISLTVFDITGRMISEASQMEYGVGLYQHSFDAADWGSGVFFIQLSAPTHTHTMKVICLK